MFTANQLEILATLVSRPEKEFYMSELGEVLGKHPGVFQRGLNSLERQGFITSRKQGNQRLLRINTSHPLFNEIRNIVQKTVGVEGALRSLVGELPGVILALIFGSYAKDKMHSDSDIDLMIVCQDEKTEQVLLEKIPDVERKLQREVNYRLYHTGEFKKKLRSHDSFVEEILGGQHIVLKGSI